MNANQKRIRELVLQVSQRQGAISRMEAAVKADKAEIQDLMVAEGLTVLDLQDIEKQVQLKDKTEITYKVADILSKLSVSEAAELVKVSNADRFDKAVRNHPELAGLREVTKDGQTVAITKLTTKV